MRIVLVVLITVLTAMNPAHADVGSDKMWEVWINEAKNIVSVGIATLASEPENSAVRAQITEPVTTLMILSSKDPENRPRGPEFTQTLGQIFAELKVVYPALAQAGAVDLSEAQEVLSRISQQEDALKNIGLTPERAEQKLREWQASKSSPGFQGQVGSIEQREQTRSITRSVAPRSIAEMERWRKATDPSVKRLRDEY